MEIQWVFCKTKNEILNTTGINFWLQTEVKLREAHKSLKETLCHQTQLNDYHVHILWDLIPSKCKNITKSMIQRN